MKRYSFLLVLIFAFLWTACQSPAVDPIAAVSAQSTPTAPPAIAPTTTATTLSLSATTPTPYPTSTPEPTITPTSAPELLTCTEPSQPAVAPRPVRLIYSNGDTVWHWDESSGEKTQVPLPDSATAPLISDDGQWIAFLKQGQAYDTAASPVPSIPLWLLDRQTGKARQVASFQTSETRKLYPQAPQISLQMQWLPGAPWLLVHVYPQPWGEGILQPTGDLFLLNTETGSRQRLLKGGEYDRYSISPDGTQIAALDTAATTAGNVFDDSHIQEGTLNLIDVSSEARIRRVVLRLTQNPWTIFAPTYSPDGERMALQVETGLAIVEARSGQIQQVSLINPCASVGCYWGGPLQVIWQPDSISFYTLTSINDYFDVRAETTIHIVQLEPAISVMTAQVIHASPWTFYFSPDRQILSYWNQPDIDTPGADLNWVTLSLMDLQEGQSRRYQAQYGLRVASWSPDNQHFLLVYSPDGNPNSVPDRLSLGSICQQPRGIQVPEDPLIDHVRWIDPGRFLAWTNPAGGIPERYTTGLYLYSLSREGQAAHIDDQLIDSSEPYGSQNQVVVLEP